MILHRFAIYLVFVVALVAGPAVAQDKLQNLTELFTRGEGDYHTYRIPAVIATKKGSLLVFCEGRKSGGGDAGNIDLLVIRSTDNGKTWSQPIVVWDDGANTCGNPAPVVDQETGTIWLPMTWNLGSDHERDILSLIHI